MPCRAAAHRLLHHVDDVPLLDKEVGPALATIRRTHPVGGRLRVAMDEHKRIWMPNVLRCDHLNIDLAAHGVLAVFADVLAANIKIAALAHGGLIGSRNRKLRWVAQADTTGNIRKDMNAARSVCC